MTLGQITWDEMLASYLEQMKGLIEGGPGVGSDVILIETCQDLLQCKCAVSAAIEAQKQAGLWGTGDQVPILVQITVETTGTMLLGTEPAAAAVALSQLPIDGIGMNCATGPREMAEHIREICRTTGKLVSVLPNAGLPVMVDGQTVFPMQPGPMAEALRHFVEDEGVNIVGGCCGTRPEHLKAVVDAVGGHAPKVRQPRLPAACTSLYSAVELRQESSVLMVAERTNANGSRKFKRLLAEEDWDGIVSMAREEAREGSHVLDVCVDYVGRDGVRDMQEVVSRLAQHVASPLMLDSTEAPVLEAGLKLAGGKCIVNSINLEDGEIRLERVCPMLVKYGAAVVALTIDEDKQAGMAKTPERKLEIATRLYELCTKKYGIKAQDILFDPLTFTIATGMDEDRKLGLWTLEGIELISKKYPECGILLGLSNISFGLKPAARVVLNSVFMHEARQRGLTAAIVHASKILPENKIDPVQWKAALDLIYDRRTEGVDPLLNFVNLFPDDDQSASQEKAARSDDRPIERILQDHIIDGENKNLIEHLDLAMKTYTPLQIINEHLLAGMKVVGELFGSGKMQLPFVLQSASVMKQSVAHLEKFMEKKAGSARGRLVLATVKGDVHDIGKNLVDIILSNNGYEVVNLGIKQPIATILEALQQHKADAIGMSGLLVKSVGVMGENLLEMNERGIKVPVLLGGAALTRHYAETTLRESYKGSLYYGKDAFEALDIMEKLATGKTHEIDAAVKTRLAKRQETDKKLAEMKEAADASAAAGPTHSDVARDIAVPRPPFWGDRVAADVPLDRIYPFVNKVALYRGQWGFKKGAKNDEDYEKQVEGEVEPIFKRLCQWAKAESVLKPSVVWGYWPAGAQGDDLVVFDPVDHDREIERFHFPRQKGRGRLCIADFFRPAESGVKDVLGLMCVTMGSQVSREARKLFEGDNYQEYLYVHGLGVECAEALAEMWHQRIRQELGIDGDDSPAIRDLFTQHYRGSRYSFGYPACPEMSDQEKLFRLLKPDRIGCVLTDNWQIDPEQSTSAIIVHHPEAKYFNV